jgi:hypothetical protein
MNSAERSSWSGFSRSATTGNMPVTEAEVTDDAIADLRGIALLRASFSPETLDPQAMTDEIVLLIQSIGARGD